MTDTARPKTGQARVSTGDQRRGINKERSGASITASAALSVGATDTAISACRQALALNPHHAGSLYRLALAEQQAGHLTDARAHMTHALAMDDRDPAIIHSWKERESTK